MSGTLECERAGGSEAECIVYYTVHFWEVYNSVYYTAINADDHDRKKDWKANGPAKLVLFASTYRVGRPAMPASAQQVDF